jgi:peroxiredoxin family protein
MEDDSDIAQAAILEIIDNQIRDNNPPETRQTLERLLSEGQPEEEAMKLIGCAVAVEIFEIMKHQESFNESRYIENLRKLPELP